MQFKDEMNKFNTDPDYKLRRLSEEQVQEYTTSKSKRFKTSNREEGYKSFKNRAGFQNRGIFSGSNRFEIITIYQNTTSKNQEIFDLNKRDLIYLDQPCLKGVFLTLYLN